VRDGRTVRLRRNVACRAQGALPQSAVVVLRADIKKLPAFAVSLRSSLFRDEPRSELAPRRHSRFPQSPDSPVITSIDAGELKPSI